MTSNDLHRHTVTTADTRAALQPTASSAVDTTQTLTEELTDTQRQQLTQGQLYNQQLAVQWTQLRLSLKDSQTLSDNS